MDTTLLRLNNSPRHAGLSVTFNDLKKGTESEMTRYIKAAAVLYDKWN